MGGGLPTTVTLSGISFVTTEPAPTIECLPIVIPGRMALSAPMGPIVSNRGILVVCEHDMLRDEYVVLYCGTSRDKNERPDFAAVTYYDAFFNVNV